MKLCRKGKTPRNLFGHQNKSSPRSKAHPAGSLQILLEAMHPWPQALLGVENNPSFLPHTLHVLLSGQRVEQRSPGTDLVLIDEGMSALLAAVTMSPRNGVMRLIMFPTQPDPGKMGASNSCTPMHLTIDVTYAERNRGVAKTNMKNARGNKKGWKWGGGTCYRAEATSTHQRTVNLPAEHAVHLVAPKPNELPASKSCVVTALSVS